MTLAALTVLLGFAGLATAGPAAAHAEVVATSPTASSTVHGTVTQVSVTFDEAVSLVPRALQVTTDAGIPVNIENPRLGHGGKLLSARIQDRLGKGRYSVAWRVQADDGHLETSTFGFAVAPSGATAGDENAVALPPSTPGEPLWPVLVAAAIALAGGLAAGFAVRRGLLIAAWTPDPDEHGLSRRDHESLRLPM